MYRTPSVSGSFTERIEEQKKGLQAEIAKAEPGLACNDLQKKRRQLDVALHLNEWLSSSGLQAPR